MRYEVLGTTLEYKLPKSNTYSLIATYSFDKNNNKDECCNVDVYIKNNDTDNTCYSHTFKLNTKRNVARYDITKAIENFVSSGGVNRTIENMEYENKCFAIGNEIEESKGAN